VIRPHKKQVIEVKPKSKAATEENRMLFDIIRAICLNEGYEFIVITDIDIREGSRLENVRAFWKYGRTPISPRHHIYCQEFFTQISGATLGDLVSFFAGRKEGRGVVFSLLYWGVVGIDINLPVTALSPVHLPTSA
jgi:hypothetical protein